MDRFDDDTLFAELREVRPTPPPKFAAELDERAAAGFPRRSSRLGAPFDALIARRRALSPRRQLIPVLTVALAALVVATGIIAITHSGSKNHAAENALLGASEGGNGIPAPEINVPAHFHPPARRSSGHGGGHKAPGAESSAETVYEAEIPLMEAESAKAKETNGAIAGPSRETANAGAASGRRDIERSAYVVLGTRPGEVAAAAAKVYSAVHAADGIVLHSSVQSGSEGATEATFELLIPSRKLDDSLATFSSIAEVRERHDATADITEPTVSAAEELADSNAAIEGLLKELAGVETEAERESVEARLREERRRHAAIRASLDHLHERAAMSEVTVRILTGRGAGVSPAGKESDGEWGVGDALRDAGHVLTIAAGVLLIALAVLAPIGLIALALWLVNRFRIRRLRERALG